MRPYFIVDEKVSWENLSLNPSAIHLLSKLDYVKMKESAKEFHKELKNKVLTLGKCLD